MLTALDQAQFNVGRIIELAWLIEPLHTFFTLQVRVQPDGGEPVWTLFKGPPPVAPKPGERVKPPVEIWTHVSGDVPLIQNLVLGECGGETVEPSSIADVVIGIKGRAPIGNSASTFKPMIFGMVDGAGNPSLKESARDTSERLPAQSPLGSATQSNLTGDLRDMPVPGLLQSCSLNKMTGCLHIAGDHGKGEVFFVDGVPVHATTMEATGDSGLIELVTWENGTFTFFREEKARNQSVTKRLDSLLMEGVTLLDQSKALDKAGFKLESYASRKMPAPSESQFEEAVRTKGVPVNMAVQKQLYTLLDGSTTVLELLRKRPLPKTEWIPLLFNLILCDFITVSDKPARSPSRRPLESVAVDHQAIQQAVRTMVRPETNLFTYPIFLFMLEQEFFRFERSGASFALVIFEAGLRASGGGVRPLPLAQVQEMTDRVRIAIRNTDIYGHYETFDYALLLPQTDIAGAVLVAQRIVGILTDSPLQPDMEGELVLAFGVGGVPEDGRDLGLLLSASSQAKNHAKKTGSAIVSFKAMREFESNR
jgi:hypothetical protein